MDRNFDLQTESHVLTLRRLYKIHMNVLKMLDRIGYDISQSLTFANYIGKNVGLSNVNLSQFIEPGFYINVNQHIATYYNSFGLFQNRNKFSAIFIKKGTIYNPQNTSNQMAVLYLSNEKDKLVNIKDFRLVDLFIQQFNIKNIIIISENGLNSNRINYINEQQQGIDFTLFQDIEFAYDKTKHALCPIETQIIKANKTLEFESKEELNTKTLPLIFEADSYGKLYGIKKGDIVQDIVMGETFEKKLFYMLTRSIPKDSKIEK